MRRAGAAGYDDRVILVPRQQRPERRAARAVLATLLAVVGHGLMVGLFLVLSHLEMNVPRAERPARKHAPRAVTLRGLTAEKYAENRGESARVKDER